jgi:trimethylamine--corrinoid protein Co-methyltransferase
MESGMGAVLAALAGINCISGPGMLDFESCQSLEKLVLDNELCGTTLRLIGGIEPKEDFPAVGILRELLAEGHLLIADHTRRHLKEELFFPGPVIDRSHRARHQREGSPSLDQRACRQVERLLETYRSSRLSEETRRALVERMRHEARRYGLERLPALE